MLATGVLANGLLRINGAVVEGDQTSFERDALFVAFVLIHTDFIVWACSETSGLRDGAQCYRQALEPRSKCSIRNVPRVMHPTNCEFPGSRPADLPQLLWRVANDERSYRSPGFVIAILERRFLWH
jgi:hypothetical protein